MKNIFKTLAFFTLLVCAIFITKTTKAADPVPPPPGQHGQTGNQAPGAPIDGGLGILLAMGAVYGGKKLYN
ncbi:MAG: hypothetical protein WCI71_08495, partial [Bacteroidota bacterium]